MDSRPLKSGQELIELLNHAKLTSLPLRRRPAWRAVASCGLLCGDVAPWARSPQAADDDARVDHQHRHAHAPNDAPAPRHRKVVDERRHAKEHGGEDEQLWQEAESVARCAACSARDRVRTPRQPDEDQQGPHGESGDRISSLTLSRQAPVRRLSAQMSCWAAAYQNTASGFVRVANSPIRRGAAGLLVVLVPQHGRPL